MADKIEKIWLHKNLKISKLVIKDSDEYKTLLKDDWKLNRDETLEAKRKTPTKKRTGGRK